MDAGGVGRLVGVPPSGGTTDRSAGPFRLKAGLQPNRYGNDRANRYVASGNYLRGPSARGALREWLGRRALRPPAPGAVPIRRSRAGWRGRLRGAGGPARADGPGPLPP